MHDVQTDVVRFWLFFEWIVAAFTGYPSEMP
jgi:hypothetical protein